MVEGVKYTGDIGIVRVRFSIDAGLDPLPDLPVQFRLNNLLKPGPAPGPEVLFGLLNIR